MNSPYYETSIMRIESRGPKWYPILYCTVLPPYSGNLIPHYVHLVTSPMQLINTKFALNVDNILTITELAASKLGQHLDSTSALARGTTVSLSWRFHCIGAPVLADIIRKLLYTASWKRLCGSEVAILTQTTRFQGPMKIGPCEAKIWWAPRPRTTGNQGQQSHCHWDWQQNWPQRWKSHGHRGHNPLATKAGLTGHHGQNSTATKNWPLRPTPHSHYQLATEAIIPRPAKNAKSSTTWARKWLLATTKSKITNEVGS